NKELPKSLNISWLLPKLPFLINWHFDQFYCPNITAQLLCTSKKPQSLHARSSFSSSESSPETSLCMSMTGSCSAEESLRIKGWSMSGRT
ncbi:hypothetical protein CUMW_149910, partial [Citrus unshiu]